jgi:Recombination endonuclease VII
MRKLRPWQFEELLRQQGGCCAICKARPEPKRRLAVDHCHKADVVRGLLCSRCNLGIAFLENDLIRHRALSYVRRGRAFERSATPQGKGYSLSEFLQKKFRTQDWRRCIEPSDRELLLLRKIEELWWSGRRDARRIAKVLRISPAAVKGLLEGKRRYLYPVYYQPWEILWPKGQPARAQIRAWLAAGGQRSLRRSDRARGRRATEGL